MNTRKFGLKLLKKAQELKRNLPNECNCYEDDSKIPALLQYIASKKIK